TDEKFNERALNFALFKNTDGKYFNYEDYRKAIEKEQTNKEKKVVYLYATDAEGQYQYIETAKNRGYDVLLFDSPLDSHFVSMLEQKLENSTFARVDADSIDKLISKSDVEKYEVSEEEQKRLDALFEEILPKENKYRVSVENLGDTAQPVLITQTEFLRRYRDMAA
ncbi:MAG TPA: molecular chaperone HtpG, partial [Bacteroidales bacterium]|nr:molecular chaperone HtpG [Bacteroidales bacterium]